MKKIFIALAAVAAMVGCSKENAQMETVSKDSFKMNASIVLDETRVTVDGEKFNEVKWEQGDNVTLSSAAGASATLTAESAGDTDVRFVGEGSAIADADTYYAIYPAMTITDGVANIELASQSGDDKDSAVLVAKAEGTKGVAIDMEFKPANALLHVAVDGATIAKAEFMAFDGTLLPQSFSYSFTEDAVDTAGEVASYVIENPAAEGFFFSLPADINMSAGYIVRLTDANNNVCSKAYNGKTFERGTTTRVNIAWSQPSVTLGEPMTSYSYYTAGQAATANSCANNVIYFPNASSYANVQNAMIAEAGVLVDGTAYAATLDTATKSFTPASVTVSSWKEYKVESYIKTKDGHVYKSAPQTVHITGLPYHADWRSKDYSDWKYTKISDKGTSLQVDSRALGCIISPEFKVPGNTSVTSAIAASTNATSLGGYDKSYAYVGTRNSSATESGAVATIGYVSDFSGAVPDTPLVKHNANLTLTTSAPCVVMTAKDFAIACNTYIYQAQITYAE